MKVDSGFSEVDSEFSGQSSCINAGFDGSTVNGIEGDEGPRLIPPVTGHGRRIPVHQTVPLWAGSLILVGVFAWATLCAWHVARFTNKGRW